MNQLPLPQIPEQQILELTGQLDSYSPEQLTQLMYELAAWSSYAEHMLAKASIDLYRGEQDVESRFASALLTKATGSVAEKKAAADSHPDVVEAKRELAEAKEKVLLIRAIMGGYDKKYNAISRELSRRSYRTNSGAL